MAEQSDVVVMCLGLDATIEGEEGDAGNEYASGDKLGLMLPGLQEELLEAVAAVGKPVILVLSAGSAIDLSWAEEHVDAIIDSWYPGARGGKAVAEAIFGEYSPSGKLPVTFYQAPEISPVFRLFHCPPDLPPFKIEIFKFLLILTSLCRETICCSLTVYKTKRCIRTPLGVFIYDTYHHIYSIYDSPALYQTR